MDLDLEKYKKLTLAKYAKAPVLEKYKKPVVVDSTISELRKEIKTISEEVKNVEESTLHALKQPIENADTLKLEKLIQKLESKIDEQEERINRANERAARFAGGGVSMLERLIDVSINDVNNEDVLKYNSDEKIWKNEPNTVSSLPDQTGNDGKYLKTDGATTSWETVTTSASWGGITGTLTAQTDLVAELNRRETLAIAYACAL